MEKKIHSEQALETAQVLLQLSKLLDSEEIRHSEVLGAFLKFIIEEALTGRGNSIKEYTIAVGALGRESDFNPQVDAVVRIHAGRLRRALSRYYNEAGKLDPILVEIPKGSYMPVFTVREIADLPAPGIPEGMRRQAMPVIARRSRAKPVLAVLPFHNLSADKSIAYFVEGYGELLSNDLALFEEFSVLSYHTSRRAIQGISNMQDALTLFGVQYVLTGSIRLNNSHLKVSVQLTSSDNGVQIWTHTYDFELEQNDLFTLQERVTEEVVGVVAGRYGLVFQDIAKASLHRIENFTNSFEPIYWFHHYQINFSHESFLRAQRELEMVVKHDPEYALAWGILGELYLDGYFFFDAQYPEDPVQEGLKCTLKAIELDRGCQQGYLTKAYAYFLRKEAKLCIDAVDQFLHTGSHCPSSWVTTGCFLLSAGDVDRGKELLERALKFEGVYPWWFYWGLASSYFLTGEYEKAMLYEEKINMNIGHWPPVIKVASLVKLNRLNEARKVRREIEDRDDHYYDPLAMLQRLYIDKTLVARFFDNVVLAV